MGGEAARQRSTTVWLLVAVATGVTLAAVVAWWDQGVLDPRRTAVPWYALAVLVFVIERSAIHLHLRGGSVAFTLSELPIAIGLYFVSPVSLIAARALGGAAALAVGTARQSPAKLALNTSAFTLEAAVAVAVFRWVIDDLIDPVSFPAVGAAVAGVTVGGVASIVLVWTAIRSTRGREGAGRLLYALASGVPISVANAAIGMGIVVILWTNWTLVWLQLVPLGMLAIAYRAYLQQRQHRDAMSFLYDTAVAVQSDASVHASLRLLVRSTAEHLRAQHGQLVVLPVSGAPSVTVVTEEDVAEEEHGTSVELDDLPEHLRSLLRGGPDEHRSRTTMWARARVGTDGVLILRVTDPVSRVDRFEPIDAEILRSLVRLAVTTVERAQLEEMKHAFLTAVSHELRTPLTIVRGGATTLARMHERMKPEQRRSLLDRIVSQSLRLEQLLGDLLDLDRLSRGLMEPRRHQIDLRRLAEDVVRYLDPRTHEVTVVGDDAVGHVDPALAERIVENLVTNALKYSPTGTTVSVEVRRQGDAVAVAVEDEGPGIPESERSRVLQPFTRLDLDHPSPGTGIGLSLVDRFATLHGGSVRIEDGSSGGARVTVVLPDAERAPVGVPEPVG